jgi:hypothetical protein
MRYPIILFMALLMGCQDPEPDAPNVITQDAQQIGSTSVVMGAEIKQIGPIKPMNYGFLFDSQSDLTILAAARKIVLGSTGDPKVFSIKLENLNPNTTYHYRGFAANGDYSKVYYSNIITFTTLP